MMGLLCGLTAFLHGSVTQHYCQKFKEIYMNCFKDGSKHMD